MAKNSNNVLAIGVGLNLDPLNKDIQDAANTAKTGMETVGKSISDAGAKADKPLKETRDKLVTLSAQLRQARLDAQQLAAGGKEMSDAFQASVAKAAALKDQIAAVDQAILSNSQTIANQQQPVMAAAKSSYNGMAMSINQLTREMPAFTYSVQTGFMAISNNIPMFVDQINAAKRANMELISTGQPVQSVFSQVASSLFSWQTLMGAGITILTVYGAEIIKWVGNLFTANAEVERINKSMRDQIIILNSARKSFKDYSDLFEQGLSGKQAELAAQRNRYETEFQKLVARTAEIQAEEEKTGVKNLLGRNLIYFSLQTLARQNRENIAKIEKEYDEKEIKSFEQKELKKRKYQSFEAVQNVTGRLNFSGFGNAPTMPKMPQLTNPLPEWNPEVLTAQMLKLKIKMIDAAADLTKAVDMTLKQGITNAFVGLGQVIGETIAGNIADPFQALGDILLQSLGQIMVQLGTQMIALGIGMAALDAGIKTLNPFIAIGGGIALVAAGAAISSISKKGYSNNNISGQPSIAQSSFGSQGQFKTFGGNLNNTIEIEGVVRGNNIELVNRRNMSKVNRSLIL